MISITTDKHDMDNDMIMLTLATTITQDDVAAAVADDDDDNF